MFITSQINSIGVIKDDTPWHTFSVSIPRDMDQVEAM